MTPLVNESILKSLNILKRLLTSFIFITVFLFFTSNIYAAETRTVRVGAYENKPKIFQTIDRKASGLFADILDFIAIQENWKLEYVFGTWEEGLDRLEKGEIDLMVDVAITEGRKAKFDFTNETVFSSWAVVYVRKDSTIDSFLDLEGKKIAILKSSVYLDGPEGIDQYLKSFALNTVLVEVDEYTQVFDLLNSGTVDAAVVSRVFGLTSTKRYPNLQATDIFFSPTELRFALTKGDRDNPYLVERIDHWVKVLKSGHEDLYLGYLKKYGLTGEEPKKARLFPQWLFPAGLGAIFTLLLITITDIFLRRKKSMLSKKKKIELI